jgi:hypothetical protein
MQRRINSTAMWGINKPPMLIFSCALRCSKQGYFESYSTRSVEVRSFIRLIPTGIKQP